MLDFISGVASLVTGYYLSLILLKTTPNMLALAFGAIVGKLTVTYLFK